MSLCLCQTGRMLDRAGWMNSHASAINSSNLGPRPFSRFDPPCYYVAKSSFGIAIVGLRLKKKDRTVRGREMEIKRAIRLKTTRVLILLCKDNSQMRIHLCLQSALASACHNDKLCKISSPRKKKNEPNGGRTWRREKWPRSIANSSALIISE